jgi:hypothetical protein
MWKPPLPHSLDQSIEVVTLLENDGEYSLDLFAL